MRFSIAVALLLTTAMTPALAGELNLPTHVDAAIVYPQGADVWRVGDVELPQGETHLLLTDLPSSVDPQSIRVEAEGGADLLINDVDSKVSELQSTAGDEKRQALQDKIQGLNDERQALDQAIADANAQKTLLLSLAKKQLVPTSSTETVKSIDAASLDGLVSLVGNKLSAVSKIVHDAQLRQRQIDREISDVNVMIEALAPEADAKLQVSINVKSASPSMAHFKIKYRVEDAGWQAFYDAKLTLPEKAKPASMALVQRAEVHQATTEAWDNVALTLSTARPNGATSAPQLNEDPLNLASAVGQVMNEAVASGTYLRKEKKDQLAAAPAAPVMDDLKAEEAPKPAKQAEAAMVIAGFNAQYAIDGRVSIDNSGQSKKVRIGSKTVDAKLEAVAVPRIDPTAYLMAAFTVQGTDPLLPGAVNLYRDDVYVGQGAMPQLSPGENAKLGFGADDLVKVKRVEVKRNSGEEGIISSRFTRTLAWDISVKNLHDTAFPVVVVDRIPFSTQDTVTIEQISQSTPATTENYELKRGVKAWSLALDPQAENTITLGYKISAPKDLPLALTE
jgi:uncharacterized protein (TIGR02231 family)